MRRLHLFVAPLLLVLSLTLVLQAQEGGERRRDRGGDNPRMNGGERPDRGEWVARMNERMKESLGVSDEEWQVLQPRIEKVTTAQRQARAGMAMGRRGGWGGPRGEGDSSPVAQASAELRQALDAENTAAEEIAQKLAALREAREKAEAELEQARAELRDLITQRQEATLVLMGILE